MEQKQAKFSCRAWLSISLPNAVFVVLIVTMVARPAQARVTYTDLYPLTTPPGFESGYTNASTVVAGQVAGYGVTTAGNTNALLYTSPSGSAVNLHPTGFTNSHAYGVNGMQQVGEGDGMSPDGTFFYHALLWTGTAASAVDLNPAGFTASYALNTSGTQQVGYGYGQVTGYNEYALLWTGTAASAIDLNPTGFTYSLANDTSGTQQVGYGYGPGTPTHALLWTGSAASAVDLNPSGFSSSFALGTSGRQQVGLGYTSVGHDTHALLWTGTAASAVDLNPTGYTESIADASNGVQQVGYGDTAAGIQDALFWNGTAASYIDLGSLLPSTLGGSKADSIICTTVYGTAYNSVTGIYDAIEWNLSPVPEPASVSMIALAPLAFRRRRQG
jgi:hypothetical protein